MHNVLDFIKSAAEYLGMNVIMIDLGGNWIKYTMMPLENEVIGMNLNSEYLNSIFEGCYQRLDYYEQEEKDVREWIGNMRCNDVDIIRQNLEELRILLMKRYGFV